MSIFTSENIIGLTDVNITGNGEIVIFINGGPGFSYNYLVNPFSFLMARYKVIFFNQLGCGETPRTFRNLTLKHTSEHISILLKKFSQDQPITVVAHSWGAVAFLDAANYIKNINNFKKIIFINPMPWLRKQYEEARQGFINRIPIRKQHQIFEKLNDPIKGKDIMTDLLPYYTPKPIKLSGSEFKLDLQTYHAVNNSLGIFDYRNIYKYIGMVKIITGGCDFISPKMIIDLVDPSDVYVMKNIGHFPFYEDATKFQEIFNLYIS